MSRRLTLGGAALLALAVPALSHADSFKITVEAAGVQTVNKTNLCATSGLCNIGVEGFDDRGSSTFTSSYGLGQDTKTQQNIIGGTYTNNVTSSTFDTRAANNVGGAGGTGKYINASTQTSFTVSLATTLASGLNYFGVWLSAIDDGNEIKFYKAGNLVYDFHPVDLIKTLGSCGNANSAKNSAYCGNPNGKVGGLDNDPNDLFAYVNFFDTNGTFDSITFTENLPSNGTTSSFQSDNHAVGYTTRSSGTAVTPEPTSLVLMGTGLVSIAVAARRRRFVDADAAEQEHAEP